MCSVQCSVDTCPLLVLGGEASLGEGEHQPRERIMGGVVPQRELAYCQDNDDDDNDDDDDDDDPMTMLMNMMVVFSRSLSFD